MKTNNQRLNNKKSRYTMLEYIRTNSYWYLIPILLFNLIFAPKLTEVGYLTKQVDIGYMGTAELVLRIAIFALPLIICVDYENPKLYKYLSVFVIGTLVYFISWLLIIYCPGLAFTRTWWIQLAPAYLPVIWLIALALMGKRSTWFIPVSIIFVTVHTISTYLKLRG